MCRKYTISSIQRSYALFILFFNCKYTQHEHIDALFEIKKKPFKVSTSFLLKTVFVKAM